MIKINGLFLDYDGTLSPLKIARPQSRVLPHTETLLKLLRRHVAVGIVTTKDLNFILPRTPFAHAWCAIAGLEMRVGKDSFKARGVDEHLPHLHRALQYAKEHLCGGVFIEEKLDFDRKPLAFCVDWRLAKRWEDSKEKIKQVLDYCRSLPLKIVVYPDQPFFDVFPCSINKGQAVRNLQKGLGLTGGVLYMGDSITDNPAFKAADVGIGITETSQPPELECPYWLRFEEVAYFLSSLFKNQFIFHAGLPGIRTRS